MLETFNTKWVAVWGNAISVRIRRPENYGRNFTLRYPVTMLLDGEAVRITLDNFCGHEPITVNQATVAESVSSSDVVNPVPITFNGSASVTIPAGERIKSDPVPMAVKRGKSIAVSLYFADFTEMRSAVVVNGVLSKGYFSIGNDTQSQKLPVDLSNSTNCFYFLSDIDVLTSEENHSIVCYGDSITAQAWVDYLMLRSLQEGDGTVAVVRKAASGTRILRQYDNITYDSYGLKGETRFPHEVPVCGADTVIIQHGINDIIHPVGVEVNKFRPWSDMPTLDDLIQGMRKYIQWAREYQMQVYLGTLLPIEGWRTYAPFREELRNAFNDWMRTTTEADGCIDFDKALRNPDRPTAFAEGFDGGDHLHPSQKASQVMAETVPLSLLCSGVLKNA